MFTTSECDQRGFGGSGIVIQTTRQREDRDEQEKVKTRSLKTEGCGTPVMVVEQTNLSRKRYNKSPIAEAVIDLRIDGTPMLLHSSLSP